jgi:hypothetical protein
MLVVWQLLSDSMGIAEMFVVMGCGIGARMLFMSVALGQFIDTLIFTFLSLLPLLFFHSFPGLIELWAR